MTTHQLNLVAAELRSMANREDVAVIVRFLCRVIPWINPRFNEALFRSACERD